MNEGVNSVGNIVDSIPLEEAIHYDKAAVEELNRLSSISTITAVAGVSPAVSFAGLAKVFSARDRGEFPEPKSLWLASTYEIVAEYEALKFLSPVEGKKVLQLGGKGTEAVKLMLAGAAAAYVVSPIAAELDCAQALARLSGVEVECRLGLAEAIPFSNGFVDMVYSGGSAHHFKTEEAFPEIARVLRPGGRFAAVEPWRAPFYSLGIKLFGKREVEVNCRPLNRERVKMISESFQFSDVRLHGTLSRYGLIALCKLGVPTPLSLAWSIMRADDAICSILGLRAFGSCVAVLAQK